MRTNTNAYTLQPDCDSEDLAPKACARCGHDEYAHELVAYWHEGACEIEGCPCAAFAPFLDEEEN